MGPVAAGFLECNGPAFDAGPKEATLHAHGAWAPEVLERREVFAAGISLTGGVLALTADPAGSQIVVSDPTPFSTGTNISHHHAKSQRQLVDRGSQGSRGALAL